MRSRATVRRAYTQTKGFVLRQSLTASWDDGDDIEVEFATHAQPSGGTIVIEPGSANEESAFYREGFVTDSNTGNDQLLGVVRPSPVAHPSGAFVQEGSSPYLEKRIDAHIDGATELTPGIPVESRAYGFVRLGPREEGFEEVVILQEEEDSGIPWVTDGAPGSIWSIDDLDILPPVGGGDSSIGVPGPGGTINPPKGMGYEDGEPPTGTVEPVVTGGIGHVIFVRIPTVSNSSIVTYKVHCVDDAERTVRGGTTWLPDPDSLVGTIQLAGTEGFDGLVTLKDFPDTHVLNATPSDPPSPDIGYWFKVVPSDGSGDAEPPYPEIGPVSPLLIQPVEEFEPLSITETLIAPGSISTPKLQANAVTANEIAANAVTAAKIAAGTITSNHIAANTIVAGDIAAGTITGDRIAGSTITGNKISGGTIDAITISAATINGGSITGVTITGGSVSSSSGSTFISLASTTPDTISFGVSGDGGLRGTISGELNVLKFSPPGLSGVLRTRTGVGIEIGESLNDAGHFLRLRSTGGATPSGLAGHGTIWFDGTNIRGRNGTGAAFNL